MAHPTPFNPTTPSMRGVRDKYLDLLLTGGTTPNPAPPATPASVSWTPGQRFTPHAAVAPTHWAPQPSPPPPPTWASPVTPGPTEGDVRLAEIAAGLVAAGGVEQRQSDTIRRLAEQLERSERKLRSLETRKRRVRSTMREDVEVNPPPRSSIKNDARRHIKFTPAKNTQDGARRGATPVPRRPNREVYEELERLRIEREEWIIGKRRSEAEARTLSQMLTDIKKNTARLLAEREDHLKVIGRLHEQVSMKHRTSRRESDDNPSAAIAPTGSNDSLVPLFNRRQSMGNLPNIFEDVRDTSPASVRGTTFDKDGDRIHGSVSAQVKDNERRSAEDYEPALPRPSERELELREELQLVVEENAKLSGRIPELEAMCSELSTRLKYAEVENRKIEKNARDNLATPISIANDLAKLVDELEILEGVSDAINFGMTPSEADELEETIMSGLELSAARLEEMESAIDTTSPNDIIQGIVTRLIRIRARLSCRYGQWLKAVGNDDSMTLETEHNANAGAETETQSVNETMDTHAIDRIIGLE